MSRKLKIKLLPNGEIKMETIGVKGKRCLDYVALMEKLADAKLQSKEFTPEYYEQETELPLDNVQNIYNEYE